MHRPSWYVEPENLDDGWISTPDSGGKSFGDMVDDFERNSLGDRLTEGIRQAHAGETHDLGSFQEYLEDETEGFGLLKLWWAGKAHEDSELVIEKYKEYGNTALLEVGQQLASVMGREVTKAEAQELGIWFFMMGKMARWKTAILKGERAGRDTLDDLAVYAFMARRVHEKGGWPDGD